MSAALNNRSTVWSIVFLALLLLLIVALFLSSSREPTRIGSKAQQSDIQALREELKQKPLSTVCAEFSARAITPFNSCSDGQTPVSDDRDNPLFYCCR